MNPLLNPLQGADPLLIYPEKHDQGFPLIEIWDRRKDAS